MANLSNINNKFIVTDGGNILIGSTVERGIVTIDQLGVNTVGLVINSTSATYPPYLYLRDQGGTGYSEIQANNDLYLNCTNVGIGTSSPSAPLNIEHTNISAEPFAGLVIKNTQTTGNAYTGVSADAHLQSHYRYSIDGALKWQTRVGNGGGEDNFKIYSFTYGADVLTLDALANAQFHGTLNVNSGRITCNQTALKPVVITATVGPSDNVRGSFLVRDDTFMGANVGGQIALGYRYLSGDTESTYTEGALIRTYKLNATTGDFSSGLKFQVRNTNESLATQLTIDPSGNVGIGTSTPYLQLDVTSTNSSAFSGTGYRTALFQSTSAVNADKPGITLGYDTTGGGIIAPATQQGTTNFLGFWTYNSGWGERVRITKDGNVGIGTTTPNNPFTAEAVLQVGDTSTATNNGLITIGSGTAGSGDIYFADGTSGGSAYRGFLSYKHNGDYLAFGTAETTRIIIDSSGNEIIYGGLTVGATSQVAGTQVAIVGGGGTNLQRWGSTSNGALQASYRFRIDQSFKFIANNGSGDNLTIDSSNGSIIPSGGIYLGGTGASNLLDDYEEGTFYATTNNDGVGNQILSKYTKIGRVVTYTVYFSAISHTAAGTAIIAGFPFTAITSEGYGEGNITHSTSVLNASGGYHASTNWVGTLNNSTNPATWSVGTNKAIMVSGFYYTTA